MQVRHEPEVEEQEIVERVHQRWLAAMKASGSTLMKLAADAGVSFIWMYKMTAGEHRNMKLTNLIRIAKALQMEPWELLK